MSLYGRKRIKAAQVNLRIDPALNAAAEAAAKEDNRTFTSMVEKPLMDHPRVKYFLRAAEKGKGL